MCRDLMASELISLGVKIASRLSFLQKIQGVCLSQGEDYVRKNLGGISFPTYVGESRGKRMPSQRFLSRPDDRKISLRAQAARFSSSNSCIKAPSPWTSP